MSAETAATADLVARGKDLQIHESIESGMGSQVEMGSDNYSQGAAPGAVPRCCPLVMEEPKEWQPRRSELPDESRDHGPAHPIDRPERAGASGNLFIGKELNRGCDQLKTDHANPTVGGMAQHSQVKGASTHLRAA